jgi:hypothetical protein
MKKIGELTKAWFSNFTSNIMGVIIGIVLTFGVSNLIQRYEEKKQLREIMTFIKLELKENKQWLENRATEWKEDFKAYQVFVDTARRRKMPADSLVQYINKTQNTAQSNLSFTAWNIFQNSGMMQKMNNVDLALRLSECYYWFGEAKHQWDEYVRKKISASEPHSDMMYWLYPNKYIEAMLKIDESRNFYYSVVLHNSYSFNDFNEVICSFIDFTLHSIEQTGDYTYEPKVDSAAEFEAFRKEQQKR